MPFCRFPVPPEGASSLATDALDAIQSVHVATGDALSVTGPVVVGVLFLTAARLVRRAHEDASNEA